MNFTFTFASLCVIALSDRQSQVASYYYRSYIVCKLGILIQVAIGNRRVHAWIKEKLYFQPVNEVGLYDNWKPSFCLALYLTGLYL